MIDDASNIKIGDVSARGELGGDMCDMRDIWSMQPRFEKRVGSSPYSMLEQPRFRAGFDFLRLRAQTGEIDLELAEWWEKFSTAFDDERHTMIEAVRQEQMQRPQQARTRVKRHDAEARPVPAAEVSARRNSHDVADASESSAPSGAFDASAGEGEFAPAKKRRRRRKPGNRDGAGSLASDQPQNTIASDLN